MERLKINIEVNPELYSKNPDSSELGRRIVSESIALMHKIGYEDFTFKKLGALISSPESSIYRYFVNKRNLLTYLTSWYWTWTEYRIVLATTNVKDPKERLQKCLELITKPVLIDRDFSFINEALLSEIIFTESIKAYHTKNVDEENEKGYFTAYKMVVQRVSDIILEIDPGTIYSHMLVSTVIEGSHQQKYFAEHLPALTDRGKDKDTITNFYTKLVFNYLKIK
jgi:AcrR family transcriptional regulator